MTTSVSLMLHTKLTGSSPGSIDHLRIVSISLSVDLVAHVFLVNILILITLTPNSIHHIRSGTYLRPVSAFERFEMRRLSRSHDSFLWISWTNIVVLISFRTVYPIYSLLLLAVERYMFRCGVWYLLWNLAISLHSLRWPWTFLEYFLSRVIKRYLNSPVGVSYKDTI